jgi:hypothetical protein
VLKFKGESMQDTAPTPSETPNPTTPEVPPTPEVPAEPASITPPAAEAVAAPAPMTVSDSAAPTAAPAATPISTAPATTVVGEHPKNHIVALLLSIFLGYLGIDRFYLGHIGVGIAKLLLCWLTFGIWWLIDVILIATRKVKNVTWED